MARFRSKPVEVEAERYRPGLEDEWAHQWRDGVLVGRYATERAAEDCPRKRSPGFFGASVPVLVTPCGRSVLALGDWIVTTSSGERRLVKADEFETLFERCQPLRR